MQPTTLTAIAKATLARVEEGRALKARCGLDDDTLKVEITYSTDDMADATVKNGDGTYFVFLSPKIASCTCKDHETRHVDCKHICATAMMILGSTTPNAKLSPFSLGDIVQLRGLPELHGKVVCVSCDTISVRWLPNQPLSLSDTRAYNVVELEHATPMPTPMSPGSRVIHRTTGMTGKLTETPHNGTVTVYWDHGYALLTSLDNLQSA